MNVNDDHTGKISRRDFVNHAGALALGLAGITDSFSNPSPGRHGRSKIFITNVKSNFDREPLVPYHFKGSYVTELWQTVARLESASGLSGIGLGTQSVLWSDSNVFSAFSEAGGNALMYALSERALQVVKGSRFDDPVTLLDAVFPEVYAYGKTITGKTSLRKTFALNSLVCVDNAAWLLYAAENNLSTFDEMIPAMFKPALSHRHDRVASIPSFSAGTDPVKIKQALDDGYFILKIKIGSAGTQTEMLEKDKAFLSLVHNAAGGRHTPHTKDGKIPYYLDANGRYEKKDDLLRLLDHARKIGAFDHIALLEEPFHENNETNVAALGVIVAADESAHTVEDAAKRIEQGYGAIVLKAIAKTLSMTLKIAKLAQEKNISCFCADLTVNPILVEWNKSVAARLKPFPKLNMGLLETNGHQYYKNWERMMTYHPNGGAGWARTKDGIFLTDDSFYGKSGGIFAPSVHYKSLVEEK